MSGLYIGLCNKNLIFLFLNMLQLIDNLFHSKTFLHLDVYFFLDEKTCYFASTRSIYVIINFYALNFRGAYYFGLIHPSVHPCFRLSVQKLR